MTSKQKYTVIVRLRVKGSKHDVTGYSAYDNKSYNKKFKNAVMNAIYIDADKRHKKIRYDTKYSYDLKNSSIAYVGKKPQKAPKGRNLQLRKEILEENRIRVEQAKKDKNKTKHVDKPISKSEQQKELYGDNKMENKSKSRSGYVKKEQQDTSEYKEYLRLKKKYEKK